MEPKRLDFIDETNMALIRASTASTRLACSMARLRAKASWPM
jgi:hypothetical protein